MPAAAWAHPPLRAACDQADPPVAAYRLPSAAQAAASSAAEQANDGCGSAAAAGAAQAAQSAAKSRNVDVLQYRVRRPPLLVENARETTAKGDC
jgi:hypothetical protein